MAGWVAGLPVPFLLAFAPAWGWIVAANLLLGVNQGLAWSMTVNMKINLVGPRNRGLAMGLNEAAGYMALGATALVTGYLAAAYGLRPVPELIGVVYAVAGLALSVLVVRDTAAHVAAETAAHPDPGQQNAPAGSGGRRDGCCHAQAVPRDLPGHQLAEPLAARRQPGGAGQQPQRRADLGSVPAAVRLPRAGAGRDRADQGRLPACGAPGSCLPAGCPTPWGASR